MIEAYTKVTPAESALAWPMLWRFVTVGALALGSGCGAARSQAEAPLQIELAPIEPKRAEQPEVASDPVREGKPMVSAFPETPLTPLADRIVALVDAIERDLELPSGPWQDGAYANVLDDRRPAGDRGVPQTPVMFGATFALYFEEGQGQPAFDNNGVELRVGLLPTGARVLEMTYDEQRDRLLRQLPRWLAPIDALSQRLIAATRAGQTEQYRLQQSDVARLLPAELGDRLWRATAISQQDVDAARQGLGRGAAFLGYQVEDLVLLTKTTREEIFLFHFRLEQDEPGRVYFKDPLIIAERVWPT